MKFGDFYSFYIGIIMLVFVCVFYISKTIESQTDRIIESCQIKTIEGK